MHPTEHSSTDTPVIHPTRSAPLCKDCRHCDALARCNHPVAPINPVDGTPAIRCKTMRDADQVRYDLGTCAIACGERATLFEPMAAAGSALSQRC